MLLPAGIVSWLFFAVAAALLLLAGVLAIISRARARYAKHGRECWTAVPVWSPAFSLTLRSRSLVVELFSMAIGLMDLVSDIMFVVFAFSAPGLQSELSLQDEFCCLLFSSLPVACLLASRGHCGGGGHGCVYRRVPGLADPAVHVRALLSSGWLYVV